MSIYVALGSATTELSDDQLRDGLVQALLQLGPRQRVIAVPPDFSRYASRAGDLTAMAYDHYGDSLVDVLPAVGTHKEMPVKHRQKMFGHVPESLFRYHDWRNDIRTMGTVPAEFVSDVTEGIYNRPWPAQLNKRIADGNHDLILSLGQVVPHEVIGMANYNKNLFVGAGGVRGINESHYIGAVYGMERVMGEPDTPLRRILNQAQQQFCSHLPLLFVLTVIGENEHGKSVVRGLFIGDDDECFWQASDLAKQVNITQLPKPLQKAVVYLDPEKFDSTWLGNKAIYRTRMAMATGGELTILAPGVKMFGEDPQIDTLIRKYGYRTTPEVLDAVEKNADLRDNLSAAAHLIHGSPENRFTVTYCPGHLSREEITGVGYRFGDLHELSARYLGGPDADAPGLTGFRRTADGEEVFFVADPAMGLWKADLSGR